MYHQTSSDKCEGGEDGLTLKAKSNKKMEEIE